MMERAVDTHSRPDGIGMAGGDGVAVGARLRWRPDTGSKAEDNAMGVR